MDGNENEVEFERLTILCLNFGEQKFGGVIQVHSLNQQVLIACFFIIKFAEHKFCSQLSEVGNTDFFFHETLLIQRNYAQLVI